MAVVARVLLDHVNVDPAQRDLSPTPEPGVIQREAGRVLTAARALLVPHRHVMLPVGVIERDQLAVLHAGSKNFYRDIVAAALQVDPSAAVEAITEEVIGFDMPGVGIQGFTRKALQMAQAGIYDLRIHHDEILWPLLRYWNLFDLQGLRPEAEQARERLAAHLAKTDRLASRFEAKRMRAAEAQECAS
jgi:fatty acid desaturase